MFKGLNSIFTTIKPYSIFVEVPWILVLIINIKIEKSEINFFKKCKQKLFSWDMVLYHSSAQIKEDNKLVQSFLILVYTEQIYLYN